MLQYTSMKAWVFIFILVRNFIEGAEEFFIVPTAWYYIKSLGQTPAFLGLVISAYSISAIFAGPVVGRLADRFAKYIKLILVLSFFMKVIGYLIYSVPASASFPLAGRFICGLADGSTGIYYGQLTLYTQEKHRAKLFVFIDGLYLLGAIFGPAISSFLTFNVNIFGWKIDAGNSSGIILVITWLIMTIISLWLPSNLGADDNTKSLMVCDDDKGNFLIEQDLSDQPPKSSSNFSTVSCLFYIIFLGLFYTSIVTFYTPLLTQDHFHAQFIHVKLLFLTSSMFALAAYLVYYIVAEYFDERKLIAFSMAWRLIPTATLAYFAFFWENFSWNHTYLLIVFVCFGMADFAFALGGSLLSKITSSNDAAFYQGLCFATVHMAFIVSRIVSGFVFTKATLLFLCLGLFFTWAVGAVWFSLEYKNLVGREKT